MKRASWHAVPSKSVHSEGFPLLGREGETDRLGKALLRRQGLLITGPAGIGKTALLAKVLGGLPSGLARRTIRVEAASSLRALLRSLLQQLYARKDRAFCAQLHREGIRSATLKDWLGDQSSSRLKGALYSAIENGGYGVAIDHVPMLTDAAAKVLRELAWMRKTPVYLVMRGLPAGAANDLASLYYGRHLRLMLDPLSPAAARELLEWCLERFGLTRLELGGFKSQVLALSGRNPGALIKMCRLAAQPGYQHGAYIKTKLIYLDGVLNLRGNLGGAP